MPAASETCIRDLIHARRSVVVAAALQQPRQLAQRRPVIRLQRHRLQARPTSPRISHRLHARDTCTACARAQTGREHVTSHHTRDQQP
jgi:hypothetical protein